MSVDSLKGLDSPQTVQRPAVDGTGDWMRVPELRLQQLATGRIEAAQVLDHGRVVAAQLRVRA